MSPEPTRPHNWEQLSPEAQAAVDREVARVCPGPDGWDLEHCRRLAALLGLRPPAAATNVRRSADA